MMARVFRAQQIGASRRWRTDSSGRHGWQEYAAENYGRNWWKSAALRRQVAIDEARMRGMAGNDTRAGVLVGKVGVSFKIDSAQLDRRLRGLPVKAALTIQRKAMRRGLVVWQQVLRGMFARHRSDYLRPHLADHVAVVSRVYRRGGARLVWGGVGIRKGVATTKAMNRAISSTLAEGGDERATFRRLFGRGKGASAFRDLPGWRLHFLESGTRSRRRRGHFYFPKAMSVAGNRVLDAIQQEMQRLVTEATR